MRVKKLWYLAPFAILIAILSLAALSSHSVMESTCSGCHEMRSAHSLWARSAHRHLACEECHGRPGLADHSRRIIAHLRGQADDIRLTEVHVEAMLAECKRCHQREHAGWLASGHSARYRDLILAAEAGKRTLAPQCLDCHAAFLEGDPSTLSSETLGDKADRRVMPCLVCHQAHSLGETATSPAYFSAEAASDNRQGRRPRASLYVRRVRKHVEVSQLHPTDRESGQASGDAIQAVCWYCHEALPDACPKRVPSHMPTGVHVGLSCLACHTPHSLETGQSCTNCHPRLSNCGIEVEAMDTTYLSPTSSHDIHFVGCEDCHQNEVPGKGVRPESSGK
ncbi:MAG: hypothetical protein EHM61_24955 [Acidobacteria bacterium]|nr:MAG: hypothetical protein EHM61_24955 [Acidobacteriota bacterium]